MTTKQIIASHATSWVQPPPSAAHDDTHIIRNLAITVGASAVVLAGLAGAQYLRTQTTVATAPVVAVQALEAYAPGGSVYAQQVPSVVPALEAYVAGGSVYAQQVP